MSPEVAVRVLNEAFQKAPDAVRALIEHRVEASELVDHAHIITLDAHMGVIGLLNGILRAEGSDDVVASVYAEAGDLLGFRVVHYPEGDGHGKRP